MKKLPKIQIRRGAVKDIDGVMHVASKFFEARGYADDYYCQDTYKACAIKYLQDDSYYCSLALHDGVVVGYFAVSSMRLFTKRPNLYECHFAVLPEYAKSSAGRDLTNDVINYGYSINALCFYSGSTSGIKQFDKSVINMYSKCGMRESGQMMRYEYGIYEA